MTTAIIVFIICYALFMLWLCTPDSLYRNLFDKVTKAKYRKDGTQLQIMLDNFRSFPDQWSLSDRSASFPKEGAKQIYISYDNKNGWEYSIPSFGDGSRPLDGFYGSQFVKQINEQNTQRETEALMRKFYPELNSTLRLK